MKRYCLPDNTLIFIETKSDLKSQISTEEVVEKALRYQALYIDVSSKTGDQIDFMLEIVSRILVDKERVNMQGCSLLE